MTEQEAAAIAERVRSEGLCLLGLRFSEDGMSPDDRFASLGRAFGEGWRAIPLDSAPGNPTATTTASTRC